MPDIRREPLPSSIAPFEKKDRIMNRVNYFIRIPANILGLITGLDAPGTP